MLQSAVDAIVLRLIFYHTWKLKLQSFSKNQLQNISSSATGHFDACLPWTFTLDPCKISGLSLLRERIARCAVLQLSVVLLKTVRLLSFTGFWTRNGCWPLNLLACHHCLFTCENYYLAHSIFVWVVSVAACKRTSTFMRSRSNVTTGNMYVFSAFAADLLRSEINPRNGKKSDKAHPPIHPLKHTNNLQVSAKDYFLNS